jgi:hypothetical protein
MKKLILSAALALLLSISSQATVFIYKASVRLVSDTESALPKLTQVFEIMNPDNEEIATVFTFVIGKQKVISVSQPQTFLYAEAPLTGGRTATVASFAVQNGGGSENFENAMLYFRGTNTSLTAGSFLGSEIKTFPRVFAGLAQNNAASQGKGKFSEQRITLSYQQVRTIAANDANQTTQQVVDALVAELKALGFILP